jgi:predicted dehydrogenase
MDRRHFLMGSAAAIGAAPRLFASANDTVRLCVIGVGGRGASHVSGFGGLPNVEVAAVCDVDESHLAKGVAQVEKAGWKKPLAFGDFRKMLEDKSIDAVSIATPNHWHTLMTILACQAGKDVYVEKPCSHNVFESQQIVAAARKYDRMVQMGTQTRSSAAVQEVMAKMREGEFGEIYMARGLCFKWRDTINRTPVSPVPAGVNYDLWTGPAPLRPFTANRFHYNWHWFWDTGNGDIGNQGIHEMDIARWGLGVKYPTKVTAIGGHFLFDDDQETPNTLSCAFEFNEEGKRRLLEFEVRHWLTNPEADITERGSTNSIGNIFYGSKGYVAVDTYTSYKSWVGKQRTPGPARNAGGDHFLNFIEAVRSRKRESLNAEIEQGAISTVLVHLANISYRVGRTIDFDAKTMTCKGDAEANKYLTRDYRKPYVVPEKV